MSHNQMFPVIVLDGPDGCGKTTLAKELCERLDAKYMHLTYRFKDRMHLYHTAAMELVLQESCRRPVVLDRWWPSEMVYARAYRDRSPWPQMGRLLDRVALKHSFTYVLCLPADREEFLAHFNRLKGKRAEMYDEGMGRVWDLFHDWYRLNYGRPHLMRYDWTMFEQFFDAHATNIIEMAWDAIAGRTPEQSDILDRRLAGNLDNPTILFLGDRFDACTRRKLWPFFQHGRSSLWLAEALELHGIPEYECGFINLCGAGDKSLPQWTSEELDLLINRAAPEQIIALGGAAADRFSRVSFKEYTVFHHPEFMLRYRPLEHDDYQRLKRCLPDQNPDHRTYRERLGTI